MAGKAFEELRVLEMGEFIATAYCTKLMADLGAEVIKVEQPGVGDEARSYGPFPGDLPHPERSGLFLYLDANKKGITLNPEVETGRGLLRKLVSRCDVFVEHHLPSWMRARGLDYPSLRALAPRLIMTSITPYGQTGPYSEYKGYDINVQSLGGISIGIGAHGRAPLRFPLSQGYYQAAVGGAIATLGALFQREITGEGQHVDISMADFFATIHTGSSIVSYVFRGTVGSRQDHRVRGQPYPHGMFPCKNGYVAIQCSERRQWTRFCEMIGDPPWTKDPKYQDRILMSQLYAEEVDALMAQWLMPRTKEEIFALGLQYRIPIGPVQTNADVVEHPHLKERRYWATIEHPEAGSLTYPGAPYKFSQTPWELAQPAPLLGQHNEEVYCRELGLSREDLAEFRRAGVI